MTKGGSGVTRILIPTMVGDDHARAVSCACNTRGYTPVRWFTADYPTRQTSSFHFDGDGRMSWTMTGSELTLFDHGFEVVWLRRPVPPVLPPTLHPDDVCTASTENMAYFKSLFYTLAENARWINSYDAHLRARNKLVQLRAARAAGLAIPPTLISNDPEKIEAFIHGNLPGNTIYKPFYPASWKTGDGGCAVLETTVVSARSLPIPGVLRLTPGIYQPYIEKGFEVRATFFGGHVIALKLHSQKHQLGKIDCRAIPPAELEAEVFALPDEVYRACRQLMRTLGIVFGCFDFIVTPQNEFVFLEVNEAGQFLWKEHVCPDTRILDVFLDFLGNPSFDFSWEPSAKRLRLAAVMEGDEYQKLCEEDKALHVAN
jgi:glutathione synthase/RimK-type ligase-like ATP-grasp enzyme